MRKCTMFAPLLATVLCAAVANAAPLTDESVAAVLARLIPAASKVDAAWRNNPPFAPDAKLSETDFQGQYGPVADSFPYKSAQAVATALSGCYTKKAILDSYTLEPPKFKDVNGRLYARFQVEDGDPRAYKWIRKGASVARQTENLATIRCRFQEQSGNRTVKTGYLDLGKENGVWKLNKNIDIVRTTPDDPNKDTVDQSNPESADFQFHALPMIGSTDYSQVLAVYVGLGLENGAQGVLPDRIQRFATLRLGPDPALFLKGNKFFVVIPRFKDSRVIIKDGGRDVFAAQPGQTLIFSGDGQQFALMVSHGAQSVNFIPAADDAGKPLIKTDKHLSNLTPAKMPQ